MSCSLAVVIHVASCTRYTQVPRYQTVSKIATVLLSNVLTPTKIPALWILPAAIWSPLFLVTSHPLCRHLSFNCASIFSSECSFVYVGYRRSSYPSNLEYLLSLQG